MKISDFMLDLNDLWGRLIPGLVLIFGLYLLAKTTSLFDMETLLSFLPYNTPPKTVLIFGLPVSALLLGELSLYPIFRLYRCLQRLHLLQKLTPRDNVRELEVTKNDDVMKFYKEHFANSALDSKNGRMFHYCKEYLLQVSPEAYSQSRKIEARINFKGGMLVPLILLSVISILAHLWVFFFLAGALLIAFFDGFRRSFKDEHQFVYRAYYNYNILQRR